LTFPSQKPPATGPYVIIAFLFAIIGNGVNGEMDSVFLILDIREMFNLVILFLL
jgi:hypothetical protein